MTLDCDHEWVNDPMFEDGTVTMNFGTIRDMNQEMRQICKHCQIVRYVTLRGNR